MRRTQNQITTACPVMQQKFQDTSTLKMEYLQRPTPFPVALPPSEVHAALQLATKKQKLSLKASNVLCFVFTCIIVHQYIETNVISLFIQFIKY
jgi:hypothetical protein